LLGAVQYNVGRSLPLSRRSQIEHRSDAQPDETLKILVLAFEVIQLDGSVQLAGANLTPFLRRISAEVPQVRHRRYVDTSAWLQPLLDPDGARKAPTPYVLPTTSPSQYLARTARASHWHSEPGTAPKSRAAFSRSPAASRASARSQ
jgi:hypothetical protein